MAPLLERLPSPGERTTSVFHILMILKLNRETSLTTPRRCLLSPAIFGGDHTEKKLNNTCLPLFEEIRLSALRFG
jgi:hypothetical protein